MASRENLRRMLNPRSVALVGGSDAAIAARQCAEMFDGQSYAVNPGRDTLGGLPCYPSVMDLPEAPDAVFLATPRAANLETVSALSRMGAGGVACFTAGYGELGEQGRAAERELVEACGDMALVGPNCYGFINYVSGAVLWPFGAGKQRCERGVALIMQSGMLPANLTMNDRSVPISHVISAGNQGLLAIEDYLDVLIDDGSVTAVGLYVEGIKDLERFTSAAIRALEAGKPIVALKAGRSRVGSQLAVSHTGSLAGSDQAFDALFRDYGVIRVDSPVVMMETLKFLSVSGAPRGKRLAAFTCSGGDAAMVADYASLVNLELPAPDDRSTRLLRDRLPDIATISNPLDYTTPLWGNAEAMPGVFAAMLDTGYDAAVVIQDFPPPHIHEDNSLYRNDALSFASAVNAAGIPGAVCSDLPENLDAETRRILIDAGITPLQGLDAGLDAIALACDHGIRRAAMLAGEMPAPLSPVSMDSSAAPSRLMGEAEGKARLAALGVNIPDCLVVSPADAVGAARRIGYPVVIKAVLDGVVHKSDLGGVQLNLASDEAVETALAAMTKSLGRGNPPLGLGSVLVEEMVSQPGVELLVGVTTDPQFGRLLVLGSGGIFVELVADTATLLLPTTPARVEAALRRLKLWPLLGGFRGRPACDMEKLVDLIHRIAEWALAEESLIEMDINPLLVCPDRIVALDVMLRNREGG